MLTLGSNLVMGFNLKQLFIHRVDQLVIKHLG